MFSFDHFYKIKMKKTACALDAIRSECKLRITFTCFNITAYI